MAKELEIYGEDDLFQAIEMIESGDWPKGQGLHFMDWPRYEITLVGESFDGGIPTRIMPALLNLQRTVDRTYARNLYGTPKRLTRDERKKTELIVRTRPGSTIFESNIAPALNHLATEAIQNMSGLQTLIAILAIAAVIGCNSMWKEYIRYLAQKKDLDYKMQMSEEETKRYQIIENLAARHASVAEHIADTNSTQGEFMKRLEEEDRLLVSGETIVDGDTAKKLRRPERQSLVNDRLDGIFTILSVESGHVRDGFRVRVRNRETRDELIVHIPEDTLPAEQIADLQNGEWMKTPLNMKINVERSGKRIRKAVLISAGLSTK